ncbi:MAG: hypothetical protein JNK16_08050 [Phycisphaerales bacterium]|nr:hypothetical protein [Phycisphaerales bacterium]
MTPLTATLIIAAFVILDVIVVTAVLNIAASELKCFAAKFPPVPPQIHSERRNFQSFGLGLINCGWCFHVTSDPHYVHLYPVWLLRKLGVSSFSIPRTELKDPRKCFGGVRVTVAGNDLRGPRWCLTRAERP